MEFNIKVSLQSVAAVMAIGTGIFFLKDRYFPPEVSWYLGTWVVDMEKTKPEFVKKRHQQSAVFTEEEIAEMDWPEPGHDMKGATFTFNKTSGTMSRIGDAKSVTNDRFEVDGKMVNVGYSTGVSSIVKYDLRVESGSKIVLIETGRDYIVPNGTPAGIEPESALVRHDGEIILETTYSIIQSLCKLPELEDCEITTNFYPTKYFLTRPDE